MVEDIDRFLASGGSRRRGFSAATIGNYGRTLRLLAGEFPDLAAISALELRGWLDKQGWGNATTWTALCAVRSFMRWQYGENHPALELRIQRLKPAPQRRLKKQQALGLLESFDTSRPKGRRDLAICALFLDSGLRISELCGLELRLLDLEERHAWALTKGGQYGMAVFSELTRAYLSAWLADRAALAIPGLKTVFCSIGGDTPGHPLTRDGLRVEVRRWAGRAGLEKLSPHDLRRSFASLSTRRGAPSRVLQKAGRWSSIEMVERYTSDIEASDFDRYFPVPGILDADHKDA